jgi:HlyD family secretion protein
MTIATLARRGLTATAVLLVAMACAEEEEPPMYQAITIEERNIVVSASAAGQIEPVTTVEVKSKASGEIRQVNVETGDAVATGDLLVKVDPRVPGNALRQAEVDLEVAQAQLANAESQQRRSAELYETQSITETEWEQANLSVANARAQLVRAERSLEDAKIAFEDTDVRAPIDGIIIEKAVEIGTVISSATNNVSGGAVLLRMANLDTVQVRSLIDETDIGKIQPGMPVTITVDAYPNRPFRGAVLKIEPQATVQQNVTMFPVLARIGNDGLLLKPGMNAEVEVHVGDRQNAVAVPNGALRTDRDVASAALVLGLDPNSVREQVADARQAAANAANGPGSAGATTNGPAEASGRETMDFNGRQIELPEGITAAQVREVFSKMRSGGGPQALSAEDRQIMTRLRSAGGGGGRAGGARRGQSNNDFLFGGNYIVFVLREGAPTAVPVRTGLTDLDFSEVRSGLAVGDTVLLLPSASLIANQQEWQERIGRVTRNSGLPIGR